MTLPIADELGVPHSRVFANRLYFNADRTFRSFDATQPTSRDYGKHDAIASIKASNSYRCVVHVGDSVADLQARGEAAADLFIGFGGNVRRPQVAAGADWFVNSFEDLYTPLF